MNKTLKKVIIIRNKTKKNKNKNKILRDANKLSNEDIEIICKKYPNTYTSF